MKPLTNIEEFLKRFDNFIDGEFRCLEVVSPTSIFLTLAAQDVARGYDWLSIKLEFNGVSDARLIEESKLALLDMDNGISLIKDNNNYAFGIGVCESIANIKSSTVYIQSTNIKYEEAKF